MIYSAMHQPIRHRGALAHYYDAQEQASALTGWNQEYLQLSAGQFRGHISEVVGSGIKLFVEEVGQSVYQRGRLPEGILAVGVPLQSSGVGMFCGRHCDADTFHVFSGSSGFEFRSSMRHTMLGLELELDHAGLPASAGVLPLQPAAHAELKRYLFALYQSALHQPELLSKTSIVTTVADFLLDRLGAYSVGGESDCTSIQNHWRLVQQSVSLVNEAAEIAPTVAVLCEHLGVSRRTLQNAFTRVLDVSPLAFVKAARLHKARTRLKAAASVTEVATACGFWHFGHFAQDYLSMFGERPSDTLRAHKRNQIP